MLTKDQVKVIGKDIDAAIHEIAARHGLMARKRTISYDETGLRCRFTLETEDSERVSYEQFANAMGLPKSGLDRTIKVQGRTFTVIGLQPKRPTNPVVVVDPSGKRFLLPAHTVACAFGQSSPPPPPPPSPSTPVVHASCSSPPPTSAACCPPPC
jgi:hypothetical protein